MTYASTSQILQQLPNGDSWLTLTVESIKVIADLIGVDPASLPPQNVLKIAETALRAAQAEKADKSPSQPNGVPTGR